MLNLILQSTKADTGDIKNISIFYSMPQILVPGYFWYMFMKLHWLFLFPEFGEEMFNLVQTRFLSINAWPFLDSIREWNLNTRRNHIVTPNKICFLYRVKIDPLVLRMIFFHKFPNFRLVSTPYFKGECHVICANLKIFQIRLLFTKSHWRCLSGTEVILSPLRKLNSFNQRIKFG